MGPKKKDKKKVEEVVVEESGKTYHLYKELHNIKYFNNKLP